MVLIQQQRRVHVEVILRVVHAQRNGVRFAIAQHARERRQVHAIRNEVERLHTRNRRPQVRIDPAGVNPRIHRRDSRRSAINGDFSLAESGVAAVTDEFAFEVRRRAQEPLLVGLLALRDHVEIRALDVRRQRESFRQRLRRIAQLHCSARSVRHRQHRVGRARRGIGRVRGIELNLGRAVNDSGVGGVDDVVDVRFARLRLAQERGVIGEVALHMPARPERWVRLRRRPVVHVHLAHVNRSGAIELNSLGDVKVSNENYLGPRPGAALGRRVVEKLCAVVREFLILKQRHHAGFGLRMRHVRVRRRRVA